MLVELRNGKRKEFKDARAKYLIHIGTAKAVVDYENRSMADKPKIQKAPAVLPELDSAGDAWNPELHTASKIQNNDGTWRKKPGARSASESPE